MCIKINSYRILNKVIKMEYKTEITIREVILVLFERSWGEVDWILPVLFELKKIRPEMQIIALFSPLWETFNKELNNRTLKSELTKIVDDIVFFKNEDLNQIKIKSINHPDQVRIILKQRNDTSFVSSVMQSFPSSKNIAFPDGPQFHIHQKFNHPRIFNLWKKRSIKHDLILLDTINYVRTQCEEIYYPKISVVGFPRFDNWWVKRLVSSQEFLSSPELKKLSESKYRFFLFATRGPTREFPLDICEYVTGSVAEIILRDESNFLFVKPHPRQNITHLKALLSNFLNPSKWMLSSLHVMQLAVISDFTISVTSTCSLDALAIGKPVVDFNQYLSPLESLNVNKEGRINFALNEAGLCIPVRNREELVRQIDNYFNKGSDKSVWKKQMEVFKELCLPGVNSSRKAAETILSTIDSRYSSEVYRPWTPLSFEKQFFFEKDFNSTRLHFQMKRLKASAMPISSIVLKELAQFFHTKIFITTETFNENLASEAGKIFNTVHYIELASDLYQAQELMEIKNQKNINLYHSANLLQLILPNINERILFFLGVHEGPMLTYKSKTNTSILEELKVIKQNNIKDSIILINNVRFFQPIKTDGFEVENQPGLQEALNYIIEINPNYQFAILGDIAIAYPHTEFVSISKGVTCCTFSRMFNNNMDLNFIFEVEKTIINGLSQEERYAIKSLKEDYISLEDSGAGGHYLYWNALMLYGENRFAEAKIDFLDAFQHGFKHWRVLWFLAESAKLSDDMNLAKEAAQAVLKVVPNFEPARNLLKI